MSTAIKLKKSAVAGRVPQTNDLAYGEIAINYADGVLYYKNTDTTIKRLSASSIGVDSSAVSAMIDQSYVNNLDVNAGTLDGQDGTYYLNYNNFTNTPTIVDSAGIASISAVTTSPADSAQIAGIVDSAFVQQLIKEDYVATIVDSAYVAIRSGDFVNNFGTVAIVGGLSIDATTGGDTFKLAAGSGVTLTPDTSDKRITIAATANQVFDFGTFAAPVGFTLDMGAI